MPRIPILKIGSARDCGRPRLRSYSAAVSLEGLSLGIDNVRHDVRLSPIFARAAGIHIAKLIAKRGNLESVISEGTAPRTLFSGTPESAPKNADLKPLVVELHKSALNRSKSSGNIAIDLLARVAVIKFLRAELGAQFQNAIDRCRTTLRSYEGVRQQKALEFRETVAAVQIAKKHILRHAGQDLFRILREIERETLAGMRRSLLGDVPASDYQIFVNRWMFLEEGRDSYLAAEHYVLVGGFENDPDSFGNIRALAAEFLGSIVPEGEAGERQIDGWLSAPENAHELVGTGEPSERAYKARLELWVELLEREKLLDLVLAAYEVVGLIPEFSPLLDPQQLKYALVLGNHWERVAKLVEDHGKLSLASLEAAAERVTRTSAVQRGKIAARFLLDFLRFHRDLRRLEALNRAAEKINLITNEKLCELSRVNGTLSDFLLPEESGPEQERSVVRHAVLKADVRDSSRLTRSLVERNMNPASYFSLNFYDPVAKLLAKYGASKVFVEGDAIIMAILEQEGQPATTVARACVLAREMLEIVGGYNRLLARSGLPTLELGVGISFQDGAPLYLLDGERRIMISEALNDSDRLSGSDKPLRKAMEGMAVPFNVYEFRSGENPDSEPLKYNVGGIRLSPSAFERLREEISLKPSKLEFPRLWGSEEVVFYGGLVGVGADTFRRILVRATRAPMVDRKFGLISWSEAPIYEVCTNPAVYAAIDNTMAAKG